MTEHSKTDSAAFVDPWAQAMETFAAMTDFYSQAVEAVLVTSTAMMAGSMERGAEAGGVMLGRQGCETGRCDKANQGDTTTASAYTNAYTAPKIPQAGRSWYRPPIQHPFIDMMDDLMKPWRTFVPDHSANAVGRRGPDMFGVESAAEVMAAYHTGTGFTMAQISFPDERSVCVTLPAPWAFLTAR